MNILDNLGIAAVNPGAQTNSWQSKMTSTALIDSINPANEKMIAQIAAATADDLETLLQRSQSAFSVWREVPAPRRGELVRQIANRLREIKDDLGKLVSIEMGKSLEEGLGEVQEMIDIADFAVGLSRQLYGNTMHSERIQHRMYEQWHPYGIVAIITAFNFPVAVWAWNAFIAAVCGNVCLWKPSTKTPLCAIAVQKICNSVLQDNGYPDIFCTYIPKDSQLIEKMLDDSRIPLVSFTGSTATGKKVASRVAERLGRVILELGGNNAVIVDEDVNLSLVIPAIVFGAVGTAGQRCTTTRRVFIHRQQFTTVIDRLVHAYRQIKIGDPLDTGCLMGPLIDQQAVKQYEMVIDNLKNQGAEILFGGRVLKRSGYYVEPTLVTKVENDWPLVQQETFAPIVYLMPFERLEHAISLQNNVAQGLSSALFTNRLQHAEQFLAVSGSDCGIANINIGTSGAEVGGAFGGEKETGGGREAGSDSWKAYMRRQTNTINWGKALPLAQGIHFDIG